MSSRTLSYLDPLGLQDTIPLTRDTIPLTSNGSSASPVGLKGCNCKDFVQGYKEIFGNPERIETKSGKRCRVNLSCVSNCGTPPKPALTQYKDGNIDIYICDSGINYLEDFWVIVLHEWGHAYDFCENPKLSLPKSCSDCQTMEKGGAETGCSVAFVRGSNAYNQCVQCAIYKSCIGLGHCTSDPNFNPKPKGCDGWHTLGVHLDPSIFPFN